MNHNSTLHALAFVEHDVLTSPNSAEMRPTILSCNDVDKVGGATSRTETDAAFPLDCVHCIAYRF